MFDSDESSSYSRVSGVPAVSNSFGGINTQNKWIGNKEDWKKKSYDMEERKRAVKDFISKRDTQGRSFLHYAAYDGDMAKGTQLFSIGFPADLTDKNLNTPLHVAAQSGQVSFASFLIQQGANINRQNAQGKTALHFAVDKSDRGMAKLLLSSGANPNIQDLEGATPLHYSAANDDLDMTKFLVHCGAFVNARDHSRETPIFWAIRESNLATVELLVNKFLADLSLANEDQETPLSFARDLSENEIVMVLQGKYNQPQPQQQATSYLPVGSSFVFQKSQPMLLPNSNKEPPLQMLPNYRPQSL